jgi:hypothetical protein
MYQLKIYAKSQKFSVTRNHIIYTIFFLGLIPVMVNWLILKSKTLSDFEVVCLSFSFLSIIIGPILKVIGRNKFKALNGSLQSTLKLEKDKIVVDEIVYDLSEIAKLEFKCNDYKGLSSFNWSNRGNYENALSNGTNNSVWIKLNDNTTYTYYFQQQSENEIHNAKSELINYYTTGKLHFQNLIDTLGITAYEEIQVFKSTLQQRVVS